MREDLEDEANPLPYLDIEAVGLGSGASVVPASAAHAQALRGECFAVLHLA